MKIILFLISFYTTFIFAKLPNDVRWVRESKEYVALCNQVYANAIDKLKDTISPNN